MRANSRAANIFAFLYSIVSFSSFSQHDSINIDEVSVSALLGERPILRLPGSVAVLDSAHLDTRRAQTLLPAMNTVPGVRMEERSPGSYRLSVRGSLLRSPFGVRNLKVYIEEMPLTNAGGETYLNLIDQWAIQRVEVHKGPDGSLFGANSGGVVRLGFTNERADGTRVEATVGSYDLYRGSIRTDQHSGRHRFFVTGAVEQNSGYRASSALKRYFVQGGDQWSYRANASLKAQAIYSSLHYETPGGLTYAQQLSNPRAARPASSFIPGAEEQRAGIYNNTFLGSLTNDLKLGSAWRHVLCLFASGTDFRNPFITNYETRVENNYGFRTWLRYQRGDEIKKEFTIGGEQQFMSADISNYINQGGTKGTQLGADATVIRQGFAFTRLVVDFYNKILTEASLSLNTNYLFNSRQGADEDITLHQKPELMPRLAASYFIASGLTIRGLVSRGYSAPSLQELRPAAGNFNPDLQPEHGWNYEVGARWISTDQKFCADVAAFIYELNDAIVRQVDASGNEAFINSGSTHQPGIEFQVTALIFKNDKSLLRSAEALFSAALSKFTFGHYYSALQDFSGNQLTGVPQQAYTGALTLHFPARLFVYLQHYHVSQLPLNDANTEWAKGNGLMQVKLGWIPSSSRPFVQISVACDNVFDELYSAGHDLNAFGGRFYNPAMGRNYFAQLLVRF